MRADPDMGSNRGLSWLYRHPLVAVLHFSVTGLASVAAAHWWVDRQWQWPGFAAVVVLGVGSVMAVALGRWSERRNMRWREGARHQKNIGPFRD
jgi:hypothetical protein